MTSSPATDSTVSSTQTKPYVDTLLALNTYNGQEKAALIRNDYYLGNLTVEIDNFDYLPRTAVYYSCSLKWKNKMLVFGGENTDDKEVVENQETSSLCNLEFNKFSVAT